jgi:hypothetical protein
VQRLNFIAENFASSYQLTNDGFIRQLMVIQLDEKTFLLLGPRISTCSRNPASKPYSTSSSSIRYLGLDLPGRISPTKFPIIICYAVPVFSMRAACPAFLTHLGIIEAKIYISSNFSFRLSPNKQLHQ